MKRVGKTPRFKVQRRLLTELPGLGKAGAMERKPYPPGQHGGKRIKYSDLRLQLEEKQKVRCHYGLREKQLLRFVKNAKAKASGVWVSKLIGLLETRLDNVVFRAGLAPSIPAAKQLVSHGQVLLNGKKVNIRSQIVRVGDVIELTDKGWKNQIVLQAQQSPRLPFPDWMEKKVAGDKSQIVLKEEPGVEAVPFTFDASLVTSYYSK